MRQATNETIRDQLAHIRRQQDLINHMQRVITATEALQAVHRRELMLRRAVDDVERRAGIGRRPDFLESTAEV